VLLLSAAGPVLAAERVEKLPDIKPSMSGRFDLALALNEQAFIVGKGEVASATRAHFVLKALPVAPGGRESTIEIVVYDGKTYTRLDNNPQWTEESQTDIPVSAPTGQPAVDHGVDLSNAPISSIGTTEVAGTATDQYQIWINQQADELDYFKLDFFIGRQDRYLHKYQVTAVGMDPDLGELKIETVVRLYDFDDPNIVVGPPTNVAPRPGVASHGLLPKLRRGGALSVLSTPLNSSSVRSVAIERISR
jgi:hypothetical protein